MGGGWAQEMAGWKKREGVEERSCDGCSEGGEAEDGLVRDGAGGGGEEASFRAYSYYNRTGGNDDDERPINGHTAAHPAAASELCINGFVACGRKITWGPGLRACKGPLIRGRHGPTTARSPAR